MRREYVKVPAMEVLIEGHDVNIRQIENKGPVRTVTVDGFEVR